jgi:hypothetical protein
MNKMFLLGRDRMGISKQELVSMLEEDELKDAILGKRRIFFPHFHKVHIYIESGTTVSVPSSDLGLCLLYAFFHVAAFLGIAFRPLCDGGKLVVNFLPILMKN